MRRSSLVKYSGAASRASARPASMLVCWSPTSAAVLEVPHGCATLSGRRGVGDGLHGTGVGVSTVFPGPIRDAGMFARTEVALPPGPRKPPARARRRMSQNRLRPNVFEWMNAFPLAVRVVTRPGVKRDGPVEPLGVEHRSTVPRGFRVPLWSSSNRLRLCNPASRALVPLSLGQLSRPQRCRSGLARGRTTLGSFAPGVGDPHPQYSYQEEQR
jgi:hypothetical protein